MIRRRMIKLWLALLLITAPAAFGDVIVDADYARYRWQKASGPVDFYEVYVSRNGAPFCFDHLTAGAETPGTLVQGSVGETIRVAVIAATMLGERGPMSPASEPLRFAVTPDIPDVLDPSVFEARSFDSSTAPDLFYDEPETGDVWIVPGDDPEAEPQFIENEPDSAWEVAATGDFDGDRVADLFWRNASTGETRIWFMDGTLYEELQTGIDPGPGWSALAVGDLDGNGQDDVFWSRDTGETLAWLLEGDAFTPESFPPVASEGWELLAAGDFDADGRDELFWHDTLRTKTALWYRRLNSRGEPFIRFAYSDPLDNGWQVLEVGDDNGDGCDDLHMRLELPGETLYQWWWMHGAEVTVGGDY